MSIFTRSIDAAAALAVTKPVSWLLIALAVCAVAACVWGLLLATAKDEPDDAEEKAGRSAAASREDAA